MSTEGEPKGRVLTRRELRELRAKGGEEAVPEATTAPADSSSDQGDAPAPPPASAPAPAEKQDPPAPHVVASTASAPDQPRTLTRRELRRLRTNEVPIVSDDEAPEGEAQAVEPAPSSENAAPAEQPADERATEPERRTMPWENPAPTSAPERPRGGEAVGPHTVIDPSGRPVDEPAVDGPALGEPTHDQADAPDGPGDEPPSSTAAIARAFDESPETAPDAPSVSPLFGADVSGRAYASVEKRSFDELLERHDATSPSSIIMTSSHRLPEGFGSTGAARGTTDGSDVDQVLIDGELPAHSSPTPIAASAAISTQKSASEVIRPPAPEKGRGLVLTLGITAGVLGIAIVGSIVAAYAMGVFN